MRLTFYGGAGEVGRNCILLGDGKDELLLDAGVKLGEKEEDPTIPDSKTRQLKAISISHAHLDHIGYLPFMFRKGCNARIYATKPTRDVMQLLLSDFLNIRQKREMRRMLMRDGGTYHGEQGQPHQRRRQGFEQNAGEERKPQRQGLGHGSGPGQHAEEGRKPQRQGFRHGPDLGQHAPRQREGFKPRQHQGGAAGLREGFERQQRQGSDWRRRGDFGHKRPLREHAGARKFEGIGFSEHDIANVLRHTEMMEYGEERRVCGGLGMTFHNAGHILGSAVVSVRGARRLLYTADLNLRETMLLAPARKGLAADVLITESTYGGKMDSIEPVKEARAKFIETIGRTLKKGGKVLVPSFAVGRGQEVLFILESHMRSGALEKVPIFVDGMIIKANRIYRQNVIYCKEEVQKRILMSEEDPFKSPLFREPSKSRSEVYREGPAIIVTTSGMMTGGPAIDYFKRLAGEPRNKLVLVGYQAEGTLGRKLLEGEKEVGFKEELVRVRMDVENVSFSAHADHAQLVEFARSVKGLRTVFIIHGEGTKPKELAEDLEKQYEVIIPKNGETFNF